MAFTIGRSRQFSIEFPRLKEDQQDAVLDFIEIYQQYGLGDFSKYPGKVTPSWKGLDFRDPNYSYTYANSLWHYHVGLPAYKPGAGPYMVSDWVLHFQWYSRGDHIDLIDLYQHSRADGSFYLPPPIVLAQPDASRIIGAQGVADPTSEGER